MSAMVEFTVFETAIGWAGLAWADKGLVGVHLPEAIAETTRASFYRRFPDAVEAASPAGLEPVIGAIQGLMRGEKTDLSGAVIDVGRVPDFNARVYEITRAISPGETLTYGDIAVKLGDRLLARDVGVALGQNPWPIVVPCHRVTAAGGKLGGFSARGGVQTKIRLLNIEGAFRADQLDLFAAAR
jgi:methylated-DNA-[protein]-cysteine S-methyltransferase